MKLLKVTETEYEELGKSFEEVETVSVDQLAPEVVDGRDTVRMNGKTVEEFDAAFLEIPEENPVFGRVLVEMMQEAGLGVNYPSVAFFIMAKKNYLSYVLHQKGVEAPEMLSVASSKASRNVGKYLDYPFVAKRFDEMVLTESSLIENQEELEEFTEGVEYGEDLVLFRQQTEGDKYRVFYCGESMVSLEDRTEGWKHSTDKLHYSNVSSDIKEQVRKAVNGIGTLYAEVLIQGGKVVDVNPNPDLETYRQVSGKNTYESVEQLVRGEKP